MTMILYNDATSPFGRKVLVAALERDVPLREEFVNIYGPGPVDRYNALRQIPTLVADDGRAVFDSDVILLFLDSLHGGAPLVPTEMRWDVLTRVALANGLMEATLFRIMELRRPDGEQSPAHVARMEERIWRALDQLNAEVGAMGGTNLRADQITTACALEYVDFRFTDEWRRRFPALADWLNPIAARPSMKHTAPTRTAPAK